MLSNKIYMSTLTLGAGLLMQCALAAGVKADAPTPGDNVWSTNPILSSQLQAPQQFSKYQVQVPIGYTPLAPVVKHVKQGTETLYKFLGPTRLDHSRPIFLVYVIAPLSDPKAWQPLLDNAIPYWVQGIHFYSKDVGNINGLKAVHQIWTYHVTGQKQQLTGTEYTSYDGQYTVAVAGIDWAEHFLETDPLLTAAALSLHD